MSTRRRGKIAQLPHAVREKVCLMLRDGQIYSTIAGWLASEGHAGITDKNVENWAKPDEHGDCGYNDWLREQERLADMQAKRDFALQVVQQNEGSTIHEAALQVAASQLYEVITEFDVASLKRTLQESPQLFAAIVDSLTKLSKGGLEFAKYRDRVAEQKRRIAEELGRARDKGGIAPETMDRIEQELKLL